MSELVSQHCEACRRDAPHVTEAEIAEYLPQIPEWEVIEEAGIKRLQRVYRFRSFAEALAFTERVGELAESEMSEQRRDRRKSRVAESPVDSASHSWYRNYTLTLTLALNFEFDDDKSHSNKQKHGIDFVKAQTLWDDPDLIEVPAHTSDETRSLVVGKIGKRCWSAIITYRNERIRIISVRRSRAEEVEIYEG